MILVPVDPRVLMDDEPLLRTVSNPVLPEYFGGEVGRLLDVMREVAFSQRARGLAAVQIGIPVRVLIARQDHRYLAFINPTLDRTLNRFASEREGCLSIPPRKWGDVSRPAKCDASWLDEEGLPRSATLVGELARIFQHELDHLNGILMTDHIQ